MITDLLIAPDIVVEACSRDGNSDGVISQALSKAKREGIKTWIYVGSIDRIHREVGTYLEKLEGYPTDKARKEASRRLLQFSKDHLWLSALSEDAETLVSPHPLAMQLCKALDRLGEGAFLLTREENFPTSRAITPEAYLSLTGGASRVVPFVDLARQHDFIRHELEKRIFAVLRHGRYIGGPEIAELEERLRQEIGVKHAITCSSGTDALLMALLALGIGPGDAVLTVPFTFVATAEVIRLVGAIPVFVDIDPLSFTMDPEALKRTLDALRGKPEARPLPQNAGFLKPKAIITVDLFGCPAPYEEILSIAKNHDLFVIEDAAQAFGASYRGKPAGSLGDIGCTSFFPAKTLGAYGDGGAIFTDSDALAEKLRLIRNHGTDSIPYRHSIIGLNGRLDSIQAAVLLTKLGIFHNEKLRRRAISKAYSERLSRIPGIITPSIPEDRESIWSQYSILTPSKDFRDTLKSNLAKRGIPTAIYYPCPLHLQPAFLDLGYREGDFPVAEYCSERILSLPMHPYVTRELIDEIVDVVESTVQQMGLSMKEIENRQNRKEAVDEKIDSHRVS